MKAPAWCVAAWPLIALALVAVTGPARAERLILALSSDEVRITSSFTGTGITVFGAIERDAATVSRGSFYDIVVVVQGPDETLVTRRKTRIAGIWLNSQSRTFQDMPSFYAVNSSRPLDDVTTPPIASRFKLGFDNLGFAQGGGDGMTESDRMFRDAFIRLKQRAGLYIKENYGVTFPGASVFQTTIALPANVPVGLYRTSVFLFRDSAMLATDSAILRISKAGFEQFTFDLAHSKGFLYGIVCVLLALVTGWLAGVLFRRD